MKPMLGIAALVVVCGIYSNAALELGTSSHQRAAESVPAGDASIAGRVVNRDTRQPLAQVVMTLASVDRRRLLTTITDADGRYLFEGVAAGEYRVAAALDGYVEQVFGTTNRGTPAGGVLHLTPKQVRQSVDFSLERGGTVTGRVLDALHQPMKGVSVNAVSIDSGRASNAFRTNDAGEYVLVNLPAGHHRIAAMTFNPELAAATGAKMERAFHPGTHDPDEALAVRVTAGETTRNVDIIVPATNLVTINGQVVRTQSSGRLEAYLFSNGSSVRTIKIGEDGAFELRTRPGRYTLCARAETDSGAKAALITVEISSDTSGIVLALAPAAMINGRVITDDGTPTPGTALYVSAMLADNGVIIDPLPRDRAEVTTEGVFQLRGLFGERVLQVSGLDEGWAVDRIMHGQTVIEALTLNPGERLDEVTIVLSRQ